MSLIVLLCQILTQVLRCVPHCFFVFVFYLCHRYMEACQIMIQVLRFVPHCFFLFFFFNLCHRYMEACQILTQVLNCVPDQEDVWLMVADIYAGCQDYHNAAKVKFHLTSSLCQNWLCHKFKKTCQFQTAVFVADGSGCIWYFCCNCSQCLCQRRLYSELWWDSITWCFHVGCIFSIGTSSYPCWDTQAMCVKQLISSHRLRERLDHFCTQSLKDFCSQPVAGSGSRKILVVIEGAVSVRLMCDFGRSVWRIK